MIKQSFKQFQFDMGTRHNKKVLKRWRETTEYVQEELIDKNPQKYQDLLKILDLKKKLEKKEIEYSEVLFTPNVFLPFCNIGRLFFIEGLGWCPLINLNRKDGRLLFEFFAFLNFSKKDFKRKAIKCNCFRCIKKYNYLRMKEP